MSDDGEKFFPSDSSDDEEVVLDIYLEDKKDLLNSYFFNIFNHYFIFKNKKMEKVNTLTRNEYFKRLKEIGVYDRIISFISNKIEGNNISSVKIRSFIEDNYQDIKKLERVHRINQFHESILSKLIGNTVDNATSEVFQETFTGEPKILGKRISKNMIMSLVIMYDTNVIIQNYVDKYVNVILSNLFLSILASKNEHRLVDLNKHGYNIELNDVSNETLTKNNVFNLLMDISTELKVKLYNELNVDTRQHKFNEVNKVNKFDEFLLNLINKLNNKKIAITVEDKIGTIIEHAIKEGIYMDEEIKNDLLNFKQGYKLENTDQNLMKHIFDNADGTIFPDIITKYKNGGNIIKLANNIINKLSDTDYEKPDIREIIKKKKPLEVLLATILQVELPESKNKDVADFSIKDFLDMINPKKLNYSALVSLDFMEDKLSGKQSNNEKQDIKLEMLKKFNKNLSKIQKEKDKELQERVKNLPSRKIEEKKRNKRELIPTISFFMILRGNLRELMSKVFQRDKTLLIINESKTVDYAKVLHNIDLVPIHKQFTDLLKYKTIPYDSSAKFIDEMTDHYYDLFMTNIKTEINFENLIKASRRNLITYSKDIEENIYKQHNSFDEYINIASLIFFVCLNKFNKYFLSQSDERKYNLLLEVSKNGVLDKFIIPEYANKMDIVMEKIDLFKMKLKEDTSISMGDIKIITQIKPDTLIGDIKNKDIVIGGKDDLLMVVDGKTEHVPYKKTTKKYPNYEAIFFYEVGILKLEDYKDDKDDKDDIVEKNIESVFFGNKSVVYKKEDKYYISEYETGTEKLNDGIVVKNVENVFFGNNLVVYKKEDNYYISYETGIEKLNDGIVKNVKQINKKIIFETDTGDISVDEYFELVHKLDHNNQKRVGLKKQDYKQDYNQDDLLAQLKINIDLNTLYKLKHLLKSDEIIPKTEEFLLETTPTNVHEYYNEFFILTKNVLNFINPNIIFEAILTNKPIYKDFIKKTDMINIEFQISSIFSEIEKILNVNLSNFAKDLTMLFKVIAYRTKKKKTFFDLFKDIKQKEVKFLINEVSFNRRNYNEMTIKERLEVKELTDSIDNTYVLSRPTEDDIEKRRLEMIKDDITDDDILKNRSKRITKLISNYILYLKILESFENEFVNELVEVDKHTYKKVVKHKIFIDIIDSIFDISDIIEVIYNPQKSISYKIILYKWKYDKQNELVEQLLEKFRKYVGSDFNKKWTTFYNTKKLPRFKQYIINLKKISKILSYNFEKEETNIKSSITDSINDIKNRINSEKTENMKILYKAESPLLEIFRNTLDEYTTMGTSYKNDKILINNLIIDIKEKKAHSETTTFLELSKNAYSIDKNLYNMLETIKNDIKNIEHIKKFQKELKIYKMFEKDKILSIDILKKSLEIMKIDSLLKNNIFRTIIEIKTDQKMPATKLVDDAVSGLKIYKQVEEPKSLSVKIQPKKEISKVRDKFLLPNAALRCDLCGRRFSTISEMREHKKTHL
uniref:C2H2-type domain-containing protein n=1 Tax=viral metagenome TaxID=1070528 RepID=A0A6C0J882_9ZZZZ